MSRASWASSAARTWRCREGAQYFVFGVATRFSEDRVARPPRAEIASKREGASDFLLSSAATFDKSEVHVAHPQRLEAFTTVRFPG